MRRGRILTQQRAGLFITHVFGTLYAVFCSHTHNTKRTAGGQMSLSTRRLQTMTGHSCRRCNCQLCICCEFCRARCYYLSFENTNVRFNLHLTEISGTVGAASGHIPIITSVVCIYTFVCFLVYRSEM